MLIVQLPLCRDQDLFRYVLYSIFEDYWDHPSDIEATISAIRENSEDLAAVLIEPMLGSGGCIPAKKDFLLEDKLVCMFLHQFL